MINVRMVGRDKGEARRGADEVVDHQQHGREEILVGDAGEWRSKRLCGCKSA
jgi:hypothetical protein